MNNKSGSEPDTFMKGVEKLVREEGLAISHGTALHVLERFNNLQKLCEEQKSQLATQTERVKKMTEALKQAEQDLCDSGLRWSNGRKRIEQALNQDSLGDGK